MIENIDKMNGWSIEELPNLVFFQEGPGVRNNQYTDSGVKLLNVANLKDGNVYLDNTDRYISEEEAYGKYSHFLVDEGDLIIASSGIKVEYFDKKMGFAKKEHLPLCMNTSTIRFKTLDDNILNIEYFAYFLKTNYFKKQISRLITGSAQLNFGPSHLKQIKVILPPRDVQKKIVEVLDKAQELIDKRKEQIDALDELVKSRFIEMFGDPVINQKQWKKEELGKVCDVRDGTHDSPQYVSDGYPLITSKNISNGVINFEDVNFISKEDLESINRRSKVDNGDIIMPMIGTIGNPVIVNTSKDFAIKNVALIKFNEKTLVTNIFIKSLLESHYFEVAISQNKRGGTQKFIALGDIRKLNVILPPIELQNQFADFANQVDKLKSQMETSLKELEDNFNSLMQKAFKGELF